MKWITEIIGFLALLFLGLAYYQNTKVKIIIFQIIANMAFLVHYSLLGQITAPLCNVVFSLILISCALRDKYKFHPLFIIIPALILYALILIFTYQGISSILSITASILGLVGFFMTSKLFIQIDGIVIDIIWTIFAIIVNSISGMITNSVVMITTIVSIIVDINKKKKGSKKKEEPFVEV